MTEHLESSDVFEGINSDKERMEKLVDKKYLSAVVKPQQTEVEFNWLKDNQRWVISGGSDCNRTFAGRRRR